MKDQNVRPDPFARFSTAELRNKRAELRALIDSGVLSDRSLDNQLAEIAMIESELARRNSR